MQSVLTASPVLLSLIRTTAASLGPGPTTVFVVTITTIRSFQVFDTVEALTLGGPSKVTYVMMFAIYEKAIQQNLIGIGAAITVAFLIFVFILTVGQRWLVEHRGEVRQGEEVLQRAVRGSLRWAAQDHRADAGGVDRCPPRR